MDKQNKKILITGTSSGIGLATAQLLLENNYTVLGTYNKNKANISKLSAKFKQFKFYQVDFSQREATYEFTKKLKTIKLDGIVNNAGMITFQHWDNFDITSWDKTMEVNLNTPLILTKELSKNINKGGSIVNIVSTDGMVGSITSIDYSASKAALINLTMSLANILGPHGIRVNAIAPGWVGTGMDSPIVNEAKWVSPLSRLADYTEIASVVKFLLSQDASYVNGSIITVDGGASSIDYLLKKESESV